MRLLQLMAGAPHGGAETFFVDLACALARAGVRQHIVTRPAVQRTARLTDAGIDVTPARFAGWWDWPTRRRIATVVRSFRPDVVLAWMNRAAAAMPSGPFATVARLGGYYDLKYYRRCAALIGNTTAICDHIVAGGRHASSVVYIPNFCPVTPEPAIDRAVLQTAPDATVLLILARLEVSKGIDLAIRALARIPNAILWIAGEGSQHEDLNALASSSGVASRVRFLGWREDRTALLRAADLVLVPSRTEPFGNVVINAWAHRKPIIASRADGPAALIEDGVDGLLVDVENADALAAAITHAVTDPNGTDRMAAAGYQRAQAEFSERAVVSRYVETLDALARGNRPFSGDLPSRGGGA